MGEPAPHTHAPSRVLLGDGNVLWLQMNCSHTLCLSDAPGLGSECRNVDRAKATCMEREGIRGRFCWVSGRGWQAGRAPTTEAGLPPRDVHPFPGTGSGVVGHGAAQAVPAIRAGADVVVTVLQVGQRAHGVVAGLELGGRQERARLLRELGCGGGERRRAGLSEGTATAWVPRAPRDNVVSYFASLIPASPSAAHAAETPLGSVIFLPWSISFPNYIRLKIIRSCMARAHHLAEGETVPRGAG